MATFLALCLHTANKLLLSHTKFQPQNNTVYDKLTMIPRQCTAAVAPPMRDPPPPPHTHTPSKPPHTPPPLHLSLVFPLQDFQSKDMLERIVLCQIIAVHILTNRSKRNNLFYVECPIVRCFGFFFKPLMVTGRQHS